jgi:hypothetical protein
MGLATRLVTAEARGADLRRDESNQLRKSGDKAAIELFVPEVEGLDSTIRAVPCCARQTQAENGSGWQTTSSWALMGPFFSWP